MKKSKFFSKSYFGRTELRPGFTFSDCCGAAFKEVEAYSLSSYPLAHGAAGKGILLSDEPPTKALHSDEATCVLSTRNGTLYITTRHP